MATTSGKHFLDINSLKLKIREKMVQLQFKEEALEKCQTQLTASQNLVCELKLSLENERRVLSCSRLELKSAMDIIARLEDEKIRGQTERAQLQISWENSLLTRDHLVNQARTAKLENIRIKRKNEILEANLSEQKLLNKLMEESLNNLRNQMSKFIPILQRNVHNLKQEQEVLGKSFRAFEQFKQQINTSNSNNCVKCSRNRIVLSGRQDQSCPVQQTSISTAPQQRDIIGSTQIKSSPQEEICQNLDDEFEQINKSH